jgi:hypothetical protein
MANPRLNTITSKTFSTLLARVNEIYKSLYTTFIKSSPVDGDYFLIRDSQSQDSFKKISAADLVTYVGSGGTGQDFDAYLTEWAQGKDYEPLVITRDSEGRVTSMTVKWPDESSGVYTATNYNVTHEVYDGYTITHSDSSKTVSQSAVTRNVEGAIINKPAINVA